MSKILIIYSYCKLDSDGEFALNFFLDNGVIQNDKYDFYFIINGKYDESLINKLPKYFNIIYRNNIGYDFGAWSDAILTINIEKYNYFLFLNNSSVGPCLPRYLKNQYWVNLFINQINDSVKLVGCTLNNNIIPHIQSYVFCVDKIGLKILIDNKIFQKKLIKNKLRIINEHEIMMLNYIKKAGYTGFSFETLRNFDEINYIKNDNITNSNYYKDTYYHELSPFEVIFVKQRLNHDNNSFLFYLKSLGYNLEDNVIYNDNQICEIKNETNLNKYNSENEIKRIKENLIKNEEKLIIKEDNIITNNKNYNIKKVNIKTLNNNMNNIQMDNVLNVNNNNKIKLIYSKNKN